MVGCIIASDSVQPAPMPVDLNGRDYFPGMFVLLRKREDKDRFGLILKASNAQKYADVQWFALKQDLEQQEKDLGMGKPVLSEPVLKLKPVLETLGREEISFYDIRSHPEYNYIGGSLVSRLEAQDCTIPNIGERIFEVCGWDCSVG